MPEQVRWEGRMTVKNALQSIALMRNEQVDLDPIIKIVGLQSRADYVLDTYHRV